MIGKRKFWNCKHTLDLHADISFFYFIFYFFPIPGTKKETTWEWGKISQYIFYLTKAISNIHSKTYKTMEKKQLQPFYMHGMNHYFPRMGEEKKHSPFPDPFNLSTCNFLSCCCCSYFPVSIWQSYLLQPESSPPDSKFNGQPTLLTVLD